MTAIDRLQGLVQSVAIKAPCLVATTGNIALFGIQTIDGIADIGENDERVLVWQQTDATQNGIYVASGTQWTRDLDFNGPNQVAQGTIVAVVEGTEYGATIFQVTTANPLVGNTMNFAPAGAAALALASAYMLTSVFPQTTAAAARSALGAAGVADNNAFSGTNTFPTEGAGDNSTKAATTAYADRSAANAVGGLTIRSYLAGLGLSNDGTTPNTKLDVAAGTCDDDTNAAMMTLAAGTIDCTTVGANGLDAGTLANSTTYHVFAIAKPGGATPAFLASASLTPTLPSGYTLKRRIGSVLTDGSAHIVPFVQDGDYFRRSTTALDVNTTNPGANAVTASLPSIPNGIVVTWFGSVQIQASSTAVALLLSDLAASNETPALTSSGVVAAPGATLSVVSAGLSSTTTQVRTNASRQIRYRLSNSAGDVIVGLVTYGWIDRRGRDA